MSAPSVMLAKLGDVAESLSAHRDTSLMTVLLILVLSVGLALCLVCLLAVVHFVRSRRLPRPHEVQRPLFLPPSRRFYLPRFFAPSPRVAILRAALEAGPA